MGWNRSQENKHVSKMCVIIKLNVDNPKYNIEPIRYLTVINW